MKTTKEIKIGSLWECNAFSKKRGYGDTGRVKVYEVTDDEVKTKSITNVSHPHYEKSHFLATHSLVPLDLFGNPL